MYRNLLVSGQKVLRASLRRAPKHNTKKKTQNSYEVTSNKNNILKLNLFEIITKFLVLTFKCLRIIMPIKAPIYNFAPIYSNNDIYI